MARECGACSLCCKLLSIDELAKPIDTWCQHCKPGNGGCSIYASRPATCVNFSCGWLTHPNYPNFGDEWFPARAKMIVGPMPNGGLLITVDPAYPNAWRREPYYSQLKDWSRSHPIKIRIGLRASTLGPNARKFLPRLGSRGAHQRRS
jgi:hypothetical protein